MTIDEFRALPAESVTWHPASDPPPTGAFPFLVAIQAFCGLIVRTGVYTGAEWLDAHGEWPFDDDVMYWALIPEPPEHAA